MTPRGCASFRSWKSTTAVFKGGRPTSDRSPQPPGTFSWFGIDGTWFWADAKNNLGFVGMIQRRGNGGPGAVNFQPDSASAVYKALPAK